MKFSDMTVSMPMSTFKGIERELESYQKLKDEIRDCFNINEHVVEFDLKKALNLCKKSLLDPNVNITIID